MPRKIKVDDSIETGAVTMLPEEISGSETILKHLQGLFPNRLNFSINDAAQILNLSKDFIRKYISAGSVRATRFGDRWMINIHEINRLLVEGIE